MHLNKGSVNYKIRIYSINTYLDINHQIWIPLKHSVQAMIVAQAVTAGLKLGTSK